MSNKSKYRQICIDTLDDMAMEGDIEAMVILIEEGHNKVKWLETLANIVQQKPDEHMDDRVRELVAAEKRKAAVKLLRLTKKLSDDEEISMASIREIRNI